MQAPASAYSAFLQRLSPLCLCIILLMTAFPACAKPLKILGVPLYATPHEVQDTHPSLPFAEHTTSTGLTLGIKALTKEGYRDGGFFQVLFTRGDLGNKAWSVTLNKRTHIENEPAAPIIDRYIAQYGPYDTLCLTKYDTHKVYHLYWGSSQVDCVTPDKRPDKAHLYLNLVIGTWTEEFLVLSDPRLAKRNIEFARLTSE